MKTFWIRVGIILLPVLPLCCFVGAAFVYWSMPMFSKVPGEPINDWIAIAGYVFIGLIALLFWYDLLPHQVARRERRAERRERWHKRMLHHIEAEYRDD